MHRCGACQKRYRCKLTPYECNHAQDGEMVCGPCAVRRFDAIAGYYPI